MALNPPITDWRGKRVWLVGASSGIGRATAELLHARGAQVIVSARQRTALDDFVRAHPGSLALALDVTDAAAVGAGAQALLATGPLDLVCYCAGYYRAQRASRLDLAELQRHLQVNYLGALNVLHAVTPALLQAARTGRAPHLSFVASVAGWRGLPRALGYGPSKAALIHLAETLFLDLRPQGVGVSIINPGFVATPMTAGNTFPMPALRTPEQAAQAIVRGWQRGAFDIHFPRRFTCVLKLLRVLPYRWYFALVHRFTGL
ncbi:SDR family NAD(P)-dependent oxidoreductase [Extensimonas vulgaris]|uniref:Short-subunit dehydrogenase n=1 Tax=Extensimonas vulgaris TaxID=1031594 RepID=A0A369APB1_9BURK|nr:SDR family NAD(P)-dependent oxidoreductase [Extensimonas vulgaris]RCX11021.1 short-subunit dehydrogenase [Extensimonas vulgaris]TWI41695.1 short-subunit dehydrogenase [Extensimonas vulgaris]TXD16160.1 SDR family NAD(P)-dependent oxidoreductase [Extensimonas vulgaris]